MTHQSAILLATLLAMAGLALGYYIAWALDQAEQWFEQYLNGCSEIFWTPEVWR